MQQSFQLPAFPVQAEALDSVAGAVSEGWGLHHRHIHTKVCGPQLFSIDLLLYTLTA